MTDPNLEGRSILVVEDGYLMAMDLEQMLHKAGAIVVGPVATVTEALDLLEAGTRIEGAILDVNVRDEWIYPVAERLLDRAIPIVFATGYSAHDLPQRFASIPRFEKPISAPGMVASLGRAFGSR